ncbi:MAG: hypothetical protein U0T75_10470 [Chitinophagales bacterium]
MSILQAFKMTCAEATRLNEKKREGKLSFAEGFGLWWHTSVVCSLCRLFFKQIAQLENATQRLGDQKATLPADKKAHLQTELEQRLKQDN